MQLKIGQKGTFRNASGFVGKGRVVWDRGGFLYDLDISGISTSETQMVPVGDDPAKFPKHAGCFMPDGFVEVPAELAEPSPVAIVAVPRRPAPDWVIYAALTLSAVGTGLAIAGMVVR